MMRRARDIKTAGAWNAAEAVDCVTLDAHGRHRRRIVLTGERGTTFMLDLPHAIALRARMPAPIITEGLEVLVQLVIAAITTWP